MNASPALLTHCAFLPPPVAHRNISIQHSHSAPTVHVLPVDAPHDGDIDAVEGVLRSRRHRNIENAFFGVLLSTLGAVFLLLLCYYRKKKQRLANSQVSHSTMVQNEKKTEKIAIESFTSPQAKK